MSEENNVIDLSAEYREMKSDRAKDAMNLYLAILKINDGFPAVDYDSSIRAASYIVYAFLGGQAARNINYRENEE